MATRVICDHCGNTISDKNPKKYAVLRSPYVSYMAMPSHQHSLGGLASGLGSQGVSMPQVNTPVVEVELCLRCDEIWLNRVKNLTAATEEENGVQG